MSGQSTSRAAYSAVCIPPCSQWPGPGPGPGPGPPPPRGTVLPILLGAAAKVGLDDAAQVKLRGLGQDPWPEQDTNNPALMPNDAALQLLTLPLEPFPRDAEISYLMRPRAG